MATEKKKTGTTKSTQKKANVKTSKPEVHEVKPEEQYVDFIIPLDPYLDSRYQLFECCLNGEVCCYPRGEMLHLTKPRFDFVASLLREIERVSPEVAEFQNASKKIDF